MSELRKLRIVTDVLGLPRIYVADTDIELYGVISCSVDMKCGCEPVAHIEIMDPDVEVKPKEKKQQPKSAPTAAQMQTFMSNLSAEIKAAQGEI